MLNAVLMMLSKLFTKNKVQTAEEYWAGKNKKQSSETGLYIK
jgi:hypothetical protein